MDLRHLTDTVLLIDTKFFVARELELTTKILHHLKEIDRRKLYSDAGCSSLFDYCVRELGYSEASAHRRIQSARLLAELPEIEQKIETGNITLTNLSLTQTFFSQNGITEAAEKKSVLAEIENMSKKECEKKLFELSGKKLPAKEGKKRISENQHKVSYILSDETLEKIEKLKGLLGKEVSMDELVGQLVEKAIEEKEKQKFKLTNRPKKTSPLPPVKVNRNISSTTKRYVYQRDKICQKCGITKNLNFDHIKPYSLGGKNTASNLRLLCSNCNQRERIKSKLNVKHSKGLGT